MTPAEMEEVESLTTRQTASVEDPKEIDRVRKRIRLQFLIQKATSILRKEFQRNGKFDPQYYHRLLAANRMTPKQYEAQLTRDLLTEKAQLIAQDVASLTPAEMKEVESLTARQTVSVEDTQEIDKVRKRIRLQFLLQKKQRALQAFQAAMRTKSEVNIREEYL